MRKGRRILISLLLAFNWIEASLLRRADLAEGFDKNNKEESKDEEFNISKYVHNESRSYSKRRIHAYCNTFKNNCDGLPYYESKMIELWVKYWEKQGWDPVVLTIEDAKRHADFTKYESSFNDKKFSGNQQHMFYRYLAMSITSGANWFSESHVLPLNPLLSDNGENAGLPYDGKFTVYDRYVPSLMSGNDEEWKRMSDLILKSAKPTDLETLTHLYEAQSGAFETEQSVMHAMHVIGEEQFSYGLCDNSLGKRAVRLSINEFQGTGPSIYNWPDVVHSYMRVWNAKCRSGRPVIFTYFEPIKSISTSRSMDLLEAWKKAWSDAGWEPVVLDLKDLMRHPRHKDIIDVFERSTGKYSMSIYDRMCFYRWFAMAVSGGGWMSDIDSFPLHMDPVKFGKSLPYKGLLTGYARHIPCLVSGSGAEWDRLGWILVDSYKIHADEFWSDMLALQEVHEVLDVFQYKRESVEFYHLFDQNEKLDDPYQMKTGNRDRCLLANDKKIVHFSHYSVRQGIEGVGFSDEDFDNQEKIAVKWLKAWKEQCSNEVNSNAVTSIEINPQTTSDNQVSNIQREAQQISQSNANDQKEEGFKIQW